MTQETATLTSLDPRLRGDYAIHIASLTLTHFRNYAQARLEVAPGPVILIGPNGAGKTNLLEAVSFLAPGRGLRRAKLADIDRKGTEQAWVVTASAHTPHGEIAIGTGRDTSSETDKRMVHINGAPARGHAALAEYISMCWLTPREDPLFMEGGTARRKFLDRLVYGFDAGHAERVNAYEYAMRERNRLLAQGRADPHWLTTLERNMAETGVAIAAARVEAVAHLNQVMQASCLSFPKAALSINGFAEDRVQAGEPAVQIEDALARALEAGRTQDAAAGRAFTGAHRSALTVTHILKQMEAEFCSTGEQKALLLSILLAEARAGARWHKRVPILLLDEVAAHLDASKRTELFEELLDIGAQAWMTGTDLALFEGIRKGACVLRVDAGTIEKT